MTHDPIACDATLSVVAAYRRAARAIVEADGPLEGPHGKALAIVRLVQMVDRELDPVARDWAREAIWRETWDLLGNAPTTLDRTPPIRYRDRVRHFLVAGYSRCPICAGPLRPGILT
jgi:hypothetical protein